MTQTMNTDWIARMLQSDTDRGVDPSIYVYHRFEWTGAAKDYYSEAGRNDPKTAVPPNLLVKVFEKPSSMSVGRAATIDEALEWVRGRHEAFAARAHRPVIGEELNFRIQIERDALRHGKPISATLSLHSGNLLWLSVVPRRRPEGDGGT